MSDYWLDLLQQDINEGIVTLEPTAPIGQCFDCGRDIEAGESYINIDISRRIPTLEELNQDPNQRLCADCADKLTEVKNA